jgi:hypothetical protein
VKDCRIVVRIYQDGFRRGNSDRLSARLIIGNFTTSRRQVISCRESTLQLRGRPSRGTGCQQSVQTGRTPPRGELVMLPRLSPGGLFLFCPLCWRSTRQLVPRFPVVRILVDPVEELFAAWLFALDR